MERGHEGVYSGVELPYWTEAAGMEAEEEALIGRWLDASQPTVEGGTGGGRIARQLAERGFLTLSAFDFVPELIEAARQADCAGRVSWRVENAVSPTYDDGEFAQLLYLQQLVSVVGDATARSRALREAARILRPGGVAIFSLLCLDSRERAPAHRLLLGWLRGVRAVRRSGRSQQELPWLRLGGKVNWGALADRGPWNHWYRIEEAAAALTEAGLPPVALGTSPQILADRMPATASELRDAELRGHLYAVCRKPG